MCCYLGAKVCHKSVFFHYGILAEKCESQPSSPSYFGSNSLNDQMVKIIYGSFSSSVLQGGELCEG